MVTLPGAATRPRNPGVVSLPEPARPRSQRAERGGASGSADHVRAAPRWRHALAEFAWLGAVGACAFGVVLAFGLLAARPEVLPVPGATAVVPVGEGDTLREVAARFAPDSDQAAVVRRIVELNRLDAARPAAVGALQVPVQRG